MIQGSVAKTLRQLFPLGLMGLGALLAACGNNNNGGGSSSSSGGPMPPVVNFAAPSPSTVAPGGSFTLSWTSSNVSACTASGGSGSDGWTGSEPTSGSATLAASATAGTYEYTLSCTGEGADSGSMATATAAEIVSSSTAPVFTTAFAATPDSVAAGAIIDLSWAASGATTCTASGGDGSDGWSGSSEPASSPSGGVPITTSSTPGSYTYALSCSGPGGSTAQTATVTVGPAVTGPVFSSALTATPATVAAGGTFVLSWATTGATACTASGGNGSTTWSGAEPTTSPSGGVAVTASTSPGTYAYLLSCSGPSGTSTAVVNLVVGAFDCGVPSLPTQALLAPQAAVTTATGGALCLVCSVSEPGNVIDANPTNYAAILTQVGLLDASESLAVTNNTAFSGGQTAGFVLATPTQALTLDLVQSLTVSTYLKGALQESASSDNPLELSLLQVGLIGTTKPAYLGFKTSKSFDAVAITNGPVAAVLGEVDVYHACVSTQ